MVSARAPQRGVTYLALLLAVAVTSGMLAAGTSVWSHVQRREREKHLLWAGDQIRKAIVAYSQAGAAGGSNYPGSLQDLLLDPRSPAKRRFLRQIYEDPMTRSTDWGLLRNPQGRIVGVYSRSDAAPVKTGRFPDAYASFEKAATYADWRFTALVDPRAAERPPAATGAATAPVGGQAASGVAGKAQGEVSGLASRAASPASSADSKASPSPAQASAAARTPADQSPAEAPAAAPAEAPADPSSDTSQP